MSTTIFNLKYPVTVKGQTFSTLTARRPKVRDIKLVTGPKAANDPIGAQNDLLAALCETPVEVFDEMDLEDARQFGEFVESFTSAGSSEKPASA